MPVGLSVSDIINVDILLSPTAAVGRNFGTPLVIGSSPIIDTTERIRDYTSLPDVASDFGTTAPEYLAATAFFEQIPQPSLLKVGRWAQSATSGLLHGASMSASVQAVALAALQTVVAGTLNVTVDGVALALTSLDFTGALNLNGVASVVAAALGVHAACTFDGTRFDIVSSSTGPGSSVGYATSPSGTDVAGLLGLSQAGGASPPVVGQIAETALAALQVLQNMASDWYACGFAPLTPLTNAVAAQIAAAIEGASPVRVIGFTTSESGAINPVSTTDLGALLAASGYSRSIVQYSSTNPFAVWSFFGRALTVNFEGSNTVLTMKFKQEPGTIPEGLTETQAAALTAKNINVFVTYQNGTAILQQGTVANGRFWDEVQGLDWLSNQIQTDLFNLFYQSLTKIPQTDAGVHILLTQVEATLSQAVTNGLVAPGVWNQDGFGQLNRGDPLPKGFYVYAPLVATQSQADREARKAPVMQAAIKMAGAIHNADVILSVNR